MFKDPSGYQGNQMKVYKEVIRTLNGEVNT